MISREIYFQLPYTLNIPLCKAYLRPFSIGYLSMLLVKEAVYFELKAELNEGFQKLLIMPYTSSPREESLSVSLMNLRTNFNYQEA